MSGSSLDGLDIAYVHLQERVVSSAAQGPRPWEYTFLHTETCSYSEPWRQRLTGATGLNARDYLLLHTEYGHYLGEQVRQFIDKHGLDYQVQLVVSHGHTTWHMPERRMTAQLGDGAALAAATGLNVVSDLRTMDVALGGQGAPIVPIGDRLLFAGYDFFLNLGGIANISAALAGAAGPGPGAAAGGFAAFDVCPANRVLNALAQRVGKDYDAGGALAATGRVEEALLDRLNALPYYGMEYPKSLANEFGTETVLPMLEGAMGAGTTAEGMPVADALRTYVEHIAVQVGRAVEMFGGTRRADGSAGRASEMAGRAGTDGGTPGRKMLVTGGGAHNTFLTERIRERLAPLGVEVVIPEAALVDYKEALVMALIGVLRWREENNVLASVTGASRDSIGGAVWIGQEA